MPNRAPRISVRAALNASSGAGERRTDRHLAMHRSVAQLLYSYLPGRTVNWENGLAIVRLESVRLASVWEPDRAKAVLEEVGAYLERWREPDPAGQGNGYVDPQFPDPRREPSRFAVGTPEAIEARYFETTLQCTRCSRLVFRNRSDLARDGFQCPQCQRPTLRQFSQVFVHGCGELIPVGRFIPIMRKRADGAFEPTSRPLRCPVCERDDDLAMPARSERVRDLVIKCLRCNVEVLGRITGRCHHCLRRILAERANDEQAAATDEHTLVTRVTMRITGFSASEAYYAHSISTLRLDKPAVVTPADEEVSLLRRLLPHDRRPESDPDIGTSIAELGRQLSAAQKLGDTLRVTRLRERIAQLVTAGGASAPPPRPAVAVGPPLAPDLPRDLEESLAFRTTVATHPWPHLVQQSNGPASLLTERVHANLRRLGLRELLLVDDLPVLSATFGYTRRAFTPIYEELSASNLPTTLRPFPSLDRWAARALGRAELAGVVPIVAREGEHEGIFISLDPERVVRWVEANGILLSPGGSPTQRLLASLEPIDRYYDRLRECPARRLIFGLVHTLSHALMRVASRLAGLERTSLGEYLLLPLLGSVVYDNSTAFKFGGMEAVLRDHLITLIEGIQDEAMSCIFDVSCIDHAGACPGCIYSPEIACRVFNHGLSRALLVGGHAPWADVTSEQRIVGYWEIGGGAEPW